MSSLSVKLCVQALGSDQAAVVGQCEQHENVTVPQKVTVLPGVTVV